MIEILDFISEHKKAVIAVFSMILCISISGFIAGRFIKSRNEAEGAYTKVENQISVVEDQLNQPKTKYRELDHGYHQERVDRDTKTLIGKGTGSDGSNEWISRFLTWNSGTEYNENREWFIEKLGANNVFCTEIMKHHEITQSFDDNRNQAIDTNIVKCQLNDVKVYVNSIDEDTGVYDYIMFAYFNSGDAFSTSNANNVLDWVQCYIITVSTDADGNVLPETFVVSAGPDKNYY